MVIGSVLGQVAGRGAGTLWRLAECDKSLGKHDRVIGIPRAEVREPSKKKMQKAREGQAHLPAERCGPVLVRVLQN